MLLTLKFLTLASLFVATGGAVFTEWGRKHQFLVLLAGVVAIVASTYLIRDIYNDLKSEMRQELETRAPAPAGRWELEAKAAAERAKKDADALAEHLRVQQEVAKRRTAEEEARGRADARSAPKAITPARAPKCLIFNGRQICE